ncbi:aldehyde dehydrogenase family protein [Phenylobacterium sp. LjRoot219]|uniref:aldehyde dehydrogenase family protein n=1 Tax=Phenylobacterium sp. LjRoot219 TaxID=3342283 RepID=UPI003ECC6268
MNLPLKIANSVFVGGEWIKASGEPEPVVNPATEEVIGLAPVATRSEVESAIAAAREAFDRGPWPRMSAPERAAVLTRFHDALVARRDDIIRILVAEAGAVAAILPVQFDRPMLLAKDAIERGARYRDTPLPPGTIPNAAGGRSLVGGVIRREPVGVVAAITPYNYPYLLNVVKLFPALVTGNTVVLKPSPFTPFSALIVAEVAAQVGLPKGVVNIVTGGQDVGELMTTDPRIDLISFTGSDKVGAAIAGQAAPTLKRLHLELGGKSAMIVRGDANLDAAVRAGMSYLMHCGQGCANQTRQLVHNSVRKSYVEALAQAHRAMKIGDPADTSVTLGPLIRESQRARVEHYVQEGLKGGAVLVTGGQRPAHLERGFFYEPTLFDDVDNASVLAQEEVFGPICAVIGFDTDEEAVEIANDSQFGLSGGIFSSDLGAAFDMACAIRTGGISINEGGSAPNSPIIPPFGGVKRSGIGREWGDEGLNAFTELKSLSFRQI